MHLFKFTTAGLVVSTIHAFLLPLTEPAEDDSFSTLPVPVESEFDATVPRIAEAQTLKLDCPGCPVRTHRKHSQDGKAKIKTDIPSHLELDFKIDHASGSDRLMLNGFELYPNSDPMRSTLAAKLVPDFPHRMPGHIKGRPGHKKHSNENAPLGFGLQTQPLAMNDEDKLELTKVDLQIIEVGNVFVDGIPNVEVKLIKSPKGGLMIGQIETTASETVQKTPMDKQEECTTLICKWRAIIMQQVARLRNQKHCGGRPGHAVSSQSLEGIHRHPGHHHMHHNTLHGHRASWGHLLKNIASHILLPIAIGIVAGVMASIVGMMVGTAIVCLWRTLVRPAGSRRHHRHGHSCHKAAQHETAAADEKSDLMNSYEEEEMPPAYVEEGVVEDKKPENDG